MQVNQKLSLLFFPKRRLKTDEWATLYVRVTIDGLDDEFSLSTKIRVENWLSGKKTVDDCHPNSKEINAQIKAAEVDLKRHFLLVQAQKGIALPEEVIASYQTPINGKDIIKQRQEYATFQADLINLCWDYVRYSERRSKILDNHAEIPAALEIQLNDQLKELDKRIKGINKEAFRIYDDKAREKTLVMAVEEYMFNFLMQVHTYNRAYTTLEKWLGRRQRYLDFLQYRYNKDDMPLAELQYSFIDDLTNYCKLIHEVNENTAMNYAKWLKAVIDRITSKGWLPFNIFSTFKCTYTIPPATYLTEEQFLKLKNYQFQTEDQYLNLIRDIYVFACFTGLSYSELRRLSPQHIKKGDDGELWIDMRRRKTGEDEKVPLLPTALEVMKKFKDLPICLRKGRILPMPTNEHWNRSLKVIGRILEFNIKMDGHDTRYYFINIVAFKNGVPKEAIKRMAGQKKMETLDHYLRANTTDVSDAVQELKKRLYDEDGRLIKELSDAKMPEKKERARLKIAFINVT